MPSTNQDTLFHQEGAAKAAAMLRVLSNEHRLLVLCLLIEHGELQGQEIRELLTTDGWRGAETHTDLTLRDRFTTATK